MIRTSAFLVLLFLTPLSSLYGQVSASLWFSTTPSEPDSVILVSVHVSSDSSIAFAQFVIEFDTTVIQPRLAQSQIGREVSGFSFANLNENLPFAPVNAGTNQNLLVQISGGGSGTFTGDSLEVVQMAFWVTGSYQSQTPLHFDQGSNRTFLSTANLVDIKGESLNFHSDTLEVADFTPPAPFDLKEPADGSWSAECRPTFHWNMSSDPVSGLASYELIINGQTGLSNIAPASTSAMPASDLEEGTLNWMLVAIDSAGNKRESTSTWLLSLDVTPPVSQVTAPHAGQEVIGTIVIKGTATDGTGIGVDSVWVSTDGGNIWHAATNTGEDFSTWEFEWTVSQDGSITVLTKTVDKLGNEEIPGEGVVVTDVQESAQIPTEFALAQNYPNPFNPETTIEYHIPKRTQVAIKIYNLLGQEIATLVNEDKATGYFKVNWNGLDSFGNQVASGIYLYRLTAGDFVGSRKLIRMR